MRPKGSIPAQPRAEVGQLRLPVEQPQQQLKFERGQTR